MKSPPLLKVAVTGSAGAGKTVVCRHLAKLGLPVIFSDQLAREAVKPGTVALRQIKAQFGLDIVTGNGSLDRQALRRTIVDDPAARCKLESIVHPAVIHRLQHRMAEFQSRGARMVIVEVPLLFETGMEKMFDRIVLVLSAHRAQVDRLVQRDATPRHEAEKLIGIQLPDDAKRHRADLVIENTAALDDLRAKADDLYQKISTTWNENG